MEQPAFLDKSHMPTDTDLRGVLGRAKPHWDRIKTMALEAEPETSPEWKFYTKKSGWTFVVRGKRRNVLYLQPASLRFVVSFVLGDKAVEAAQESDLPAAVKKRIRDARRYPEGRGVSVEVTKAGDIKTVEQLLAIKMGR